MYLKGARNMNATRTRVTVQYLREEINYDRDHWLWGKWLLNTATPDVQPK